MERYKFTFIDVDGNARYQLKHDCKGWAEYGVSYGRETRISNVVKSYTDSYGFIKEDADWLVSMLFSHGPNRRIKFVVERCSDFLAGTYRKEYVGYVDLTQLEIGMGEVTVPICSGGFFKALENKWGEEYEIDAEDFCVINGNIINEVAKLTNPEGESGNVTAQVEVFYFTTGCVIKIYPFLLCYIKGFGFKSSQMADILTRKELQRQNPSQFMAATLHIFGGLNSPIYGAGGTL